MKRKSIIHSFVDYIPTELEDGTIYVSLQFATAVHKCCCGCGNKVVTPLSPTDWKLIFDGETISLHPSIGNWSFPCQSHYWMRGNRIEWARKLSPSQIDAGREADRAQKALYLDPASDVASKNERSTAELDKRSRSWLRRLF